MHVVITLAIIGLVVFFFIRNSLRSGAAVAVRNAQAGVRAGAGGSESFAELIAEFESVTDVAPTVREALRAAVEQQVPEGRFGAIIAQAAAAAVARAAPAVAAEASIARKAKKKKAHGDTTERPRSYGHGAIEPLEPLARFAPLPPASPLRKRRPLPIQAPLEPTYVPAAYAARS